MAVTLTPEMETKLRDHAGRAGRDTDSFAESVLTDFLNGKIARVGPDIPYVDDEDYDTLNRLIAEADADFAEGRFKSLDQMIADKRLQFGIEL